MNFRFSNLFRVVLVVGLLVGNQPVAEARRHLEERVERLERLLLEGTLAEMVNEMEGLRNELQLVRGQLEVTQHELEVLKKRQRELYADSDRRVRELEQKLEPDGEDAVSEDSELQSTDAATATDGKSGPPAEQGENELQVYQSAFGMLGAGQYREAAKAFDAFLEQYPDGEYADNALYWLGETYYVMREFDQAKPYFQRVVDTMPDSEKRPDALLKIGFIELELNNPEAGKAILEQVQQDFPDTTAATLARQRLQQLGG